MRRKVALTAAAVAMVGTLAVGGTLAWFTDTETATNVVTTGNIDIVLNEDGTNVVDRLEGVGTENGLSYSDIMPGDVINKDVDIALADGSNDAWVRARIEFSGALIEDLGENENPGKYVDLLKDGTTIFGEDVTWGYDENKEVWYTYVTNTSKLTADNATFEVFDQVKFADEAIGNEFSDTEVLNIEVIAEAIQADNIDSAEKAWTNTIEDAADPEEEVNIKPITAADSNADLDA